MSADRPAVSSGGPGVSRAQGPVSDRVPCRIPSLCFDTCATVPETQLLPAVLLTNLPVTSTDCPAVQRGAWRFPGPPFRGRSAIALIQSCSPCSHLPWLFSDVSGMPLPSMSIDQLGPSIGQEHRRGPASNRPPPTSHPCQWSNSDYAGKRYVLGRSRESRSRPGNYDSRPGNVISRELTSLIVVTPGIILFCF